MTKKDWIITAVIVLAIVTAMSLYYVPRIVVRTVNLPEGEPLLIQGYVSNEVKDPILGYKTEDAEEMAAFLAALQPVEMRYVDRKNIYEVGEVSADVFVHYGDGGEFRIFLSDNGAVRYNDKNYKCKDTAAVKDLLARIQSWELYHMTQEQNR